jgi:Methyl-coenzyme M reductase operon protein C
MYKILGYSSGIYRFDELIEFVEDSGGIVLNRDEFQIIRGSYFLSQEVHVIIVIPEEALDDFKNFAEELKGDIEELEVEDEQKIAVISVIPIYDVLSYVGSWVNIETLEGMIDYPGITDICEEFEGFSCTEDIEKILDAMCRMEIAENRISSGNREYRVKKR